MCQERATRDPCMSVNRAILYRQVQKYRYLKLLQVGQFQLHRKAINYAITSFKTELTLCALFLLMTAV